MRNLGLAILVSVSGFACGGDEGEGTDAAVGDGGADAHIGPVVNGCPTYPEPLAAPGQPTGGRDYATTAVPFFMAYCTRCHATTRTGADRNFAPEGFDWDDEATVRAHLDKIRDAVGVDNIMPPSEPTPSCEERLEVVRWIDLGAP